MPATIAKARKALDEIKKTAPADVQKHYDTLSSALEALSKRVEVLEKRVYTISHAPPGGMI
ncbi:MAG TPA: hypothetical protein VGH39_10330 [Xanthobacteraceae bacterium]|jgi:hypothetical protein